MRCFTLFFILNLGSPLYILHLQPSQFRLAIFKVLSTHIWLVATSLESAALLESTHTIVRLMKVPMAALLT